MSKSANEATKAAEAAKTTKTTENELFETPAFDASANANETSVAVLDQPTGDVAEFAGFDDFMDDAGYEDFDARDQEMPYLLLLQTNSPQVKKGDAHIDGAEEGDTYSTYNSKLYKSGELKVLNCAYHRAYYEFEVDESMEIVAFVQEHDKNSQIRNRCEKKDVGGKTYYIRPDNSHIIEDTAYHYVLVLDDEELMGVYPAIMKFTRTKLRSNKSWNTMYRKFRNIKVGNRICPVPDYANVWSVQYSCESNDDNSWVNWSFEHDRTLNPMSDREILLMAKQFRHEVLSGKAKPIDHTVDDAPEFEDTSGTDVSDDINGSMNGSASASGSANGSPSGNGNGNGSSNPSSGNGNGTKANTKSNGTPF